MRTTPTYDQLRAAIGRIAEERSEWAGMPMPIEGMKLSIHDSYPFAKDLSKTFCPKPSTILCHEEDVHEDVELRNEWRSFRDGRTVHIWREGKKFFRTYSPIQNTGPMLINTIGASRAWGFDAEVRAMETLRRHINGWQFECYVMTGMFIESSKKSGVSYAFRRLRPTIAMTGNPTRDGKDLGMRILCCLCAHPIGYYENSWAGAMVPTDDVIAHLLLMRSDEYLYWKQCNQHPAWAPESGI